MSICLRMRSHSTFRIGARVRRAALLAVAAGTLAACASAVAPNPTGSSLPAPTGAPPSSTSASVPSAGTQGLVPPPVAATPSPSAIGKATGRTVAPAGPGVASKPPTAGIGGSGGGAAPGVPFVCPLDSTTALGAICAPASDLRLVSAAAAILSPAERAAANRGWIVRGAAPCAVSAPPAGCTSPDTALGEVTIELRNPAAAVRILVYRRGDGSLGATPLR